MLINDQKIWKDIPEYEGLYQASIDGFIRSIDREIKQFGHKRTYTRVMKGKLIKSNTQNNGYQLVWLCKNGSVKAHLVHRLVATTFLKNKDDKKCINHKDYNKNNNRLENLEWCSHSENIKHAHKNNNRKKYGSNTIQ